MSNIDENKEIIRTLLKGWGDWTQGPTIDLLADNFQYEHRCNAETFPFLLSYDGKKEMIRHCLTMVEMFPDISRTPTNMVAEDDTVIVENICRGHSIDGKLFEVFLIDIFKVSEGIVISQREYADTAYFLSWRQAGEFIRGH
ncbi:nuclear transport factor 2 family protein [Nocardia sp. NPDC001965]